MPVNTRDAAPGQPASQRPSMASTPDAPPEAAAPAAKRPSALIIRDALLPALMQSAVGAANLIDGHTFKAYRDALVREGGGQDVLEQLLLEQIAMAHLASFQLQAKAGAAAMPEAAGIYATAATKLMGEVRRTIMALKGLRTPPSPANSISVTQQVHLAKAEPPPEAPLEKNGQQSELTGNHEAGHNRLREIFGAGAGRSAKRETAGAID